MAQAPRAATGPQILAAVEGLKELLIQRQDMFQLAQLALERMIQVEESMRQLVERMERIERIAAQQRTIDEARAERVDKYVLDDAFNVLGSNAQLISAFDGLRDQLWGLMREIKRDRQEARTALSLQLGGANLAERGEANAAAAPRVRHAGPAEWRRGGG